MMWFAFAIILAVVGYYSWKSVEAPAPLMKKPEAPKPVEAVKPEPVMEEPKKAAKITAKPKKKYGGKVKKTK